MDFACRARVSRVEAICETSTMAATIATRRAARVSEVALVAGRPGFIVQRIPVKEPGKD